MSYFVLKETKNVSFTLISLDPSRLLCYMSIMNEAVIYNSARDEREQEPEPGQQAVHRKRGALMAVNKF